MREEREDKIRERKVRDRLHGSGSGKKGRKGSDVKRRERKGPGTI